MHAADGSSNSPDRGLRHRIRPAADPAPVPQPRARTVAHPTGGIIRVPNQPQTGGEATAAAAATATELLPGPQATVTEVASEHDSHEQGSPQHDTSDAQVVRSTGSMALATLVSRITGFLRTVVLGASLGPAVGSAFNTANTLPNLITEIVLGAVLTSLVVPVLVRAEAEDPDQGAAFIRRLMTLSLALLAGVTVLAVIGAPWLVSITLGSDGKVNVVQAEQFAYLLLPQILFYGMFSLFMAVLNVKGVFKPGAWAPVVNNIVVLVVFGAYWLTPGVLLPDDQPGILDQHVLLLGLGTTAGVVIQTLILLPYIKSAGIDIRPLWGIDDRLKQFGGMALAIVVYVAISQAGYVITTRIAAAADARAPLIYQQAWLLLQVPYGIIGVTMLTAIMPRLSRNAAMGDDKAVVKDLTLATKLTLVSLVPIIVFFSAFGVEIATALFAYSRFTAADARILGWTLSFSAFTLVPYAIVLLHLRVYYAREEAWTPTFIIAGITSTKIVLSLLAPLLAASPSKVVILLGAANGCGFIAGAVIGALLLRRKLGPLGLAAMSRTLLMTVGVSAVAAAIAHGGLFVVDRLFFAPDHVPSSMGYLLRTAVAGVVFLGLTVLGLVLVRLEEMSYVTGMLARIPVVGSRIAAVHQPTSAQNEVQADPLAAALPAVEANVNSQAISVEAFAASPVPPPLSAGVVRGPKLVPGAPVADGAYRLLADHGSVPGARFWQAKATATGELVALTFVDTTGSSPQAPLQPAAAAAAAQQVLTRTQALAELHEPAIPEIILMRAYRSGCLIVARWQDGSPLKTVASQPVDPRGAAWALTDLAKATATAHQAGLAVGIDHAARIRITPAGQAVLAFPAVLATASQTQDVRAIGSALALLCAQAPDVPAPVADLAATASRATTVTDSSASATDVQTAAKPGSGMSAATLYHQLVDKSFAGTVPPADDDREPLPVETQPTPHPEQTSGGFGSAGYTRKGTAILFALSVALVLLAAALALYVFGLLNGDEPDAPVKQNPIANVTGSSDYTGDSKPVGQTVTGPVAITGVTEWQPQPIAPGFTDNPELAPLAVDNDPATGWTTDVYANQFGATPPATKPGIGLLLTLAEPVPVTAVSITSPTPGAAVQLYEVGPATPADGFTTLNQALLIGGGVLEEGTTEVDTTSRPVVNRILVWVNVLPDSRQAAINEITVTGLLPVADDNPPVDANPRTPAAAAVE
ncbi:murein biosynthesis integral membrane protein MurJ [Corynebacterium choanae]|nr:murein biosynthesis integral membrane protein MurJ [Corynebacterium choanae]